MPFLNLTPQLLQKGLTGLGIAAGQIKQLDEETRAAASRFAMRALGSGDLNQYLKDALAYVEERDRQPARPQRATARVVEQGEFVEDTSSPRGTRSQRGSR
jgi:hypothetical protein